MSTFISHWRGTHRVCPPEETLERITPALSRAGITRVADLTWLDSVGIPTYQAARPGSKTLTVSMGKGVTPALARVSALMECLEWWVAENFTASHLRASIGEARDQVDYDPLVDLDACTPNLLSDETICDWVQATRLADGMPSFLPLQVLRLDAALPSPPQTWKPPGLLAATNGLASGNTRSEAILHALLEIIERESVVSALSRPIGEWRWIDGASIPEGSDAEALIRRYHDARNHVEIVDISGEFGVPCIYVRIWSPAFPARIAGFGCHLDREIALTRALTEAAQNRLNQISGIRDDIPPETTAFLTLAKYSSPAQERVVDFDSVPQAPCSRDIDEDVTWLTQRVWQARKSQPLVATLSPDDAEFSVVRVICPGILYSIPFAIQGTAKL